MTDRVDSQEAEDVAREVGRILSSHMEHGAVAGHEHGKILGCLPVAMVEVGDYFRTGILARLVREGQIRELEALKGDFCDTCAAVEEQPTEEMGEWWHADGIDEFGQSGYCEAGPLHARIAALKGEG